ncbi:MAG: Clavaminate synthase-like protein [Rhodospirillales bacterium]|nr:Clavaminate synthase-like protein [Rhodospirillales bacterium]
MSLGVDTRNDFDSVPVIDFVGMLTEDPKEKAKVAAALRDACSNVGFFYIKGHGVPQTLIDAMFAQCPRFFGLPLEEKMALHVKKSSHLLGYVALKDENANQLVGTGDLHEAFDFVSEDIEISGQFLPGDMRQPGNHWPELNGFHELLTEYSVEMRKLAKRLFGAFALALDLPENYFDRMSDRPMSLVRMLYYPSQPGPFDESKMGTGAHTDHECFTILGQDSVQALQVKNHRGEWIDAPRIPGTFVVNIGDQMARWTNGFFASTFHRVANLSGKARYSIPCFVGANPDAVIEALPSCVSPENPPKYAPVVAGEYVTNLIYHQFHENHQPHPSKLPIAGAGAH